MFDWVSVYTFVWLGWLLYFALVETYALLYSKSGTLSAQIWAILGVGRDERGSIVFSWRRLIALAGLIVLTGHLIFGIP